MTLSYTDTAKLRNAGFTDYEIFKAPDAFNTHETSNLGSAEWQRALRSRKEWTDDKLAKGWSRNEIENVIMSYYADDDNRTPWDFLREAYDRSFAPKAEYYPSVRARTARRKTAALYKK